jgi:hypothetical protein
MKLTPPKTYEPKSDLERAVCEVIVQLVGGEVFNLQTLEAYLAGNTHPSESFKGFDYIACTGVRWSFNGLPRAGEYVGVKCGGKEISVEVVSRWMT